MEIKVEQSTLDETKQIVEQEIAEYLMHPEDVLFEYKLKTEKRGKVMESDIRVRALTKEFLEQLIS